MQFRHFLFLYGIPLFFLFGFSNMALAQEVTTNASGEKIVVFEDGSWRYFNPETDWKLEEVKKVSVKNSKKKKEKKKKEKKPRVKKQKTKKPKKAKKTKAQKPSKKQKTKKKKTKNNKKKSGKKSKGKKVVKSKASPETIRRSEQLAARRAERASMETARAHRVFENVSLERVFLEKDLQEAYASLEFTDSDIAQIEAKLQKVRGREKIALEAYTKAEALSKEYEEMVHISYYKREKLLAKKSETEKGKEILGNDGAAENDKWSKAQSKKAEELRMQREKTNVMLHPPKKPCELVYNGLDEFSGKIRKDMSRELFFSYTNEKMRPYFKDREFISCQAGLTSISGGIYFLNFDLEVASENAQREYGFLEKGGALIIKMIDGSTVRIVNRKTDMGTLNPLQKSVIYKPQYLISSNQAKDLGKGEVDRVRVVWSTGYEDYEIYELDFFINQFRCLEE